MITKPATRSQRGQANAGTRPAGRACEDARVIRHVVLLRFHDLADAPEAKARLEQLPAGIPTLLTMDVGLDVLPTEASYDLALITTHDDLAGYQAYVDHPVHQEFLAWVKPRLAGRAVVDSEH
jgi:hypothetical protein